MKRIVIVTSTRAEYGLLKPIILKLMECDKFDVRIAVTGAHLSPEFGLTYKDIEKDKIQIDGKIEMLLSSDTASSISKSIGLALISFSDYLQRIKPDMLILLGDRYETLAVAIAAMNERIPIAHLYGGETTEGAIDESIRHAITKLSYLHFTSTEQYRNRVIQLGESPDRVFCVGAIGVENILKCPLMNKAQLSEFLKFNIDKPYAVVTFHPATLDGDNAEQQISEVLKAFNAYNEISYVFTGVNADANGRIIKNKIDEFVNNNNNAASFTSLGTIGYLSALKHCAMVIGNSSSGLIEAPSFGIPTVNIGDRQKGRIQADSVINCKPLQYDVEKAVALALTHGFKENARVTVNPYGDGDTSGKIVDEIEDFLINDKVFLKKVFYDY